MLSGHVVKTAWQQIHRAVHCAVPPDAAEDVLNSGEEASGTVYQDRGTVTRNETGDGGIGQDDRSRKPTNLCVVMRMSRAIEDQPGYPWK